MQPNIEKKVAHYCTKHHLLHTKDRIVVGVSGGADSVCLLLMLMSLQKKYNLKLHVVHINHGIRSDAGADAAYVKELCDTYGLPFYLYEKDIPWIAKERTCGEEEAGRMVRYEAFFEVMKKEGCNKIAVAHNSNDRAETMLFHLFRGTGLAGLASIRPAIGDIIRPILCLNREDIEEYLKIRHIKYRHDSTNDSDEYTRNKIRHNILPYAQTQIVQGCVENMHRTADILAETEDYLVWQTKKAVDRCLTEPNITTMEEDTCRLDVQAFLQEHPLIQKRIVLTLLKMLTPQNKDIAAIHVEDTVNLFHMGDNRSISLPYGISGSRQYGYVLLERTSTKEPESWKLEPAAINLQTLGNDELRIQIDEDRYLYIKLLPYSKEDMDTQDIPRDDTIKWFDYSKIRENLIIRTRQEGDYLSIRSKGEMHRKKLKDYMIEEKILKQHRNTIPLLADGNHILWVIGHRISEYYKIGDTTNTILQIRVGTVTNETY